MNCLLSVIGIRIKMSCIVIDMFILTWNRNGLLQVTKLNLVNYCHYLQQQK